MRRWLACLIILWLSFAFDVTALQCYLNDQEPEKNHVNTYVTTCEPDESICFEYEGDAYTPPKFRLVYQAGCGRPDICDKELNLGACTVCNRSRCNDALITRLKSENLVCFSYSAAISSTEASSELNARLAVCPTGETQCFQAHYPAGSEFSIWTQVVGGCGNASAGCNRPFPTRKCSACSMKECNKPDLASALKFGSDQGFNNPIGAYAASGLTATHAWVSVCLAVANYLICSSELLVLA